MTPPGSVTSQHIKDGTVRHWARKCCSITVMKLRLMVLLLKHRHTLNLARNQVRRKPAGPASLQNFGPQERLGGVHVPKHKTHPPPTLQQIGHMRKLIQRPSGAGSGTMSVPHRVTRCPFHACAQAHRGSVTESPTNAAAGAVLPASSPAGGTRRASRFAGGLRPRYDRDSHPWLPRSYPMSDPHLSILPPHRLGSRRSTGSKSSLDH